MSEVKSNRAWREECESLRQKLATALAACKAKDGTILEVLECASTTRPPIRLREALAIQPDDSALKAWLGEPVAWLHDHRQDSDVITDAVKNVWNGVVVGKMAQYSIPLYAPKGMK